MIVWEFAWLDYALVILDEWLSNRGGRLNRFDFSKIKSRFNSFVEETNTQLQLFAGCCAAYLFNCALIMFIQHIIPIYLILYLFLPLA